MHGQWARGRGRDKEDPREIRYHLEGGKITDLSPADAVLSFMRPDVAWDDSVMNTFCHYVLNFTGPESAASWVADHPDTFTISLDDGLAIARHHVDRTFGAALDSSDAH